MREEIEPWQVESIFVAVIHCLITNYHIVAVETSTLLFMTLTPSLCSAGLLYRAVVLEESYCLQYIAGF